MPHSDPASPGDEGQAGGGTSLEQRLADVVAAYRALQAENDSYRERVSRNAERRFAQRHERLLLRFIDILDNLDRALDASELGSTGSLMIEGLILVRTQLLQTLQEEGLERIPVVGIPYDPEVAEAVGTQPVDDPDHHHVVMKDIRRGYRLNGKLARAAQVIVGEYAGERPAAEPPEPPPEDSGRVEVVGDGTENTGALAALAAQAAAAIESQESPSDAQEPDSDGGEPAGLLGDVDLEAAAREAAAMAEGEEAEEPDVVLEGDEEASGQHPESLISDEDSLEQAAREAAALVGEDDPELVGDSEPPQAATETAPAEAGASHAGDVDAEGKPRRPPSHPLDEVDPSVFEDPEAER